MILLRTTLTLISLDSTTYLPNKRNKRRGEIFHLLVALKMKLDPCAFLFDLTLFGKTSTHKQYTLEYQISVTLRLFILEDCTLRYALI